MKNITNMTNCVGCGTCQNVCPNKAIILSQDNKGFLCPEIDQSKCVNCEICKKMCPINNNQKDISNQVVYALKNISGEKRNRSSSGGVFCELSEYIIKQGGYVFGAIFDDGFVVCHIGTNNLAEATKFQTSKYTQSNLGDSFLQVKKLLEDSKIVLFSGTPCQIFGLNSYLKKPYENLITCDVVCHGVSSPTVFEEYKKTLENKYKSKICGINFKYKKNKQINVKIEFKNGKKYVKSNGIDSFMKLYKENYILRESCYSCKFTNLNRVSDITVGDFWGVEKSIPGFNDGKGVSLCILNTNKGKKLFQNIKKHFVIKQSDTYNCLQASLTKPPEKPQKHNEFWDYYNKSGYDKSATKYARVKFMFKIKKKLLVLMSKINLK